MPQTPEAMERWVDAPKWFLMLRTSVPLQVTALS